jgi:pimeloyl-ACP methyl ester carboxylesterase
MAIADDLHKLILAAKIAAPVVMVGHSMGGFDVKLHAAVYPEDVAGLVLVDPAVDRGFDRLREVVRARFGAAIAARLELGLTDGNLNRVTQVESCALATREHDLIPKSDIYNRCADPAIPQLGPEIAAERQRIQVTRTYQETQASEFSNGIYANARADAALALLFSGAPLGDKPVIVLTRSAPNSSDPTATASFFAWNAAHDQTAKLSRRGVNRIVPDSQHYIHIDHPTAVVDAIDEVLRKSTPKK